MCGAAIDRQLSTVAEAVRAGRPATPRLSAQLIKLAERDGWTCHLCGDPVPWDGGKDKGPTRDHIVPRSLGGPNSLDNLRLAHAACNRQRGNQLLAA
jgi:5-methylcytosine-specific restriction endonuclease McrA